MAQFFEVHPDNPQARLLKQAAALLAGGAVAAVLFESIKITVSAIPRLSPPPFPRSAILLIESSFALISALFMF